MATPVSGGTIWQYTQRWVRGGSQFFITQLLQDKNDVDFTDYADAALKLMQKQVLTNGKVLKAADMMSSVYALVKQTMQPIYPARKRLIELDDGGIVSGTKIDPPLPPNTAATLEKYSDVATRWGYGTNHLPFGCQPDMLSGGSWSADFLTAMSAFGAAWLSDWLSTDGVHVYRPVLWSKKAPTRVTNLIGTAIGTAVRVMIRRTLGRGI